MKITINILRNRLVWLSMLILFVVACDDDINYQSGNLSSYEVREVEVPVMFDIEEMISADPPSRSPEDGDMDAELRVHDFWLIQFDPKGKRVTKPYYHRSSDGDHVPMVVPVKEDVQFRCVVIANTNDPDLFTLENTQSFEQIKDLAEMEIPGGNFCRADRMFCVVEDGKQYPLMSGESWVDYRTNGLGTVLRCYFAQVLLHFRFEGEQFKNAEEFKKLKSIKVVNIPKRTYRYTGEEYHEPDMNPESLNRKDYTFWEIMVAEDGSYAQLFDKIKNERSFDYLMYLPRRLPMTASAHDTNFRTAIQFEFLYDKDGVETTGYQIVEIRKADTSSEYGSLKEIVPRTKYDMTIRINNLNTSSGGDYYFMTEDLTVIKNNNPYKNGYVLAHANSFIINPEKIIDNDGTKLIDRHLKIPLSRIDQFYYMNSVMKDNNNEPYYDYDIDRNGYDRYGIIDFFGKGNPVPIEDDTKWTAEILWQDTPERLIYFVNDDGLIDFNATNAGAVTGTGTATIDNQWNIDSKDDGLCFRLTGAKGNLIIGIRKDYMSSNTSYDWPNGSFPFYDETTSMDKQYLWCFHLWITDYEPKDEDVIMDRNLGAMSTDDPGLYYYSNRKDPVPYTALNGKQVYDHLGNPTECIQIGGNTPSRDGYKLSIYKNVIMGYNQEPWDLYADAYMGGAIDQDLQLRRLEWACYSLRHPLLFQSNDDGYWFNPEHHNQYIDAWLFFDIKVGNSIYDYLEYLWEEGQNYMGEWIGKRGNTNSVMLTMTELPLAEEPINRKSFFDPCPDGWRLPENASDIPRNTRNMKGQYWTSTYNTNAVTNDGQPITIKMGYDATPFKIKGRALNVNGGSVTESYLPLATFLPVRCVRYKPKKSIYE